MVSEAEKYAKDDESVREKVSAKNGLESYAYNLRNSLNDDKLKDKFDAADRETLDKAINEAVKWLESNQEAEKEEFEHKQKDLEKIAMPIMQKLYGSTGAPPGGFAGGAAPGGRGAPGAGGDVEVEELD